MNLRNPKMLIENLCLTPRKWFRQRAFRKCLILKVTAGSLTMQRAGSISKYGSMLIGTNLALLIQILNLICSFASGTVHKELTNDDEDYHYNANPYNKCSPEYGCPRMTWTVDLDSADENFECPIFDMPSKKGI